MPGSKWHVACAMLTCKAYPCSYIHCTQDRAILHAASSDPYFPKTYFFSTYFATRLWKVGDSRKWPDLPAHACIPSAVGWISGSQAPIPVQDGGVYSYDNVVRWTGSHKLSRQGLDDSWWPLGCELILIPVSNQARGGPKNGTHWTLIAVYPKEERLVYIDSMHVRSVGCG